MGKKLRLIKMNIYVCHDQFSELEGTDFDELQETLRLFASYKGRGKDCVSIVRVLPTLAFENTIDVELVAFNESGDLITDTNAADGIRDIVNEYLDIDIGHITVKQCTDPFVIMGDLDS